MTMPMAILAQAANRGASASVCGPGAALLGEVAPDLREFGIECKELFLLAELDAHPHPAALADALLIPKPK